MRLQQRDQLAFFDATAVVNAALGERRLELGGLQGGPVGRPLSVGKMVSLSLGLTESSVNCHTSPG